MPTTTKSTKTTKSSGTKKKLYKECPFCKNEIKLNAIKCQYCGEFFDKVEDKIEKEVKSINKTCPFCLNKIDNKTEECPFCGENIGETPLIKQNTSNKTKTGMSLTLKIILGGVFIIFGIIFLWNLFSSSSNSNYKGSDNNTYDIIDYNDAIIDSITACSDATDRIPDDTENLTAYQMKNLLGEILKTCENSLYDVRTLGSRDGDYSFQNSAINYLEKWDIFLNHYVSLADVLYSNDYNKINSNSFQSELELFEDEAAAVDDAWNKLNNTQIQFAKKYNYRLDY